MGRIHALPDHLIDRIAAGEVVERPASVVKELVENGLDAGSSSIEVRLLAGGKRRIEVVDDGVGMDRDDALMCLERHATSKLSAVEELDSISTLGFRGEALSSIAAVSRFLLRSSTEAGAGTEIEVRGGKVMGVREIGLPRGTTITVERLFFNTPARRKFLRTEATELAHAVRHMTRFALAHPRVRFRLQQAERVLLRAEPASDPLQRVTQVLGRATAARLIPVEAACEDMRVHGFAGRPVDALARRDGQHMFVNGRAVQDRLLAHAVSQAYANTMPRGRHPTVVIHIELPPGQVDVNVHPQKSEVRFHDPGRVHDRVRDALSAALSTDETVPRLSELRPAAPDDPRPGTAQAIADYLAGPPDRRGERFGRPSRSQGQGGAGFQPGALELAEPHPVQGDARPGPPPSTPRLVADGVPEPLAQFRDSYIIAQDELGLVLVDQHAAHERILFERFLTAAEENRVETQRLMFPVTVELSPAEAVLLEQEADEFRRLGFEFEPFGGSTVRLDGVPAVAAETEAAALLRELIGEAGRVRSATSRAEGLRERLVTTAACRAAIKVRHALNRDSMRHLLEELFRTRHPSTCPHGRPLIFRLTLEEIERAFRRR